MNRPPHACETAFAETAPPRLLAAAGAAAQPALASRRLRSEDLFGAAPEVEITHGTAIYRLRRTSLGKLILTK